MTLIVSNRAREALCPAASNINVALTAADRKILVNALVRLRIAIQTHPVVREEGVMEIVRAGHDGITGGVGTIGRPEGRHPAAV